MAFNILKIDIEFIIIYRQNKFNKLYANCNKVIYRT